MLTSNDISTLSQYLQSPEFNMPPVDEVLSGNPLGASQRAQKRFPAPEEWRKRVEERLRRVTYPQPSARSTSTTFFDHLQKKKLLKVVLDGQLFWEIRIWFQIDRDERLLSRLRKEKLSPAGYDLNFHRKMIVETLAHALHVRDLVKEHRVDPGWVKEHLRNTDLQLLWETNCVFNYLPLLGLSKKRYWKLRTDAQLAIYDSVLEALKNAKVGRGAIKLAEQLTALLTSRRESIDKNTLNPTPAAIRKKVEYRNRKKRNT